MCSKVLNGHIILTDTSITTILAPEMTYTPEKEYRNPLSELRAIGYDDLHIMRRARPKFINS